MDNLEYDRALHDYLLEYVTDNKHQKFDEILAQRTRVLTVVLEDIFKSHNASAVLRTSECLGIQDVHIIEQDNEFNLNPYVLRGSGKWLTIHHHLRKRGINNTEMCYNHLKSNGYTIIATTPHDAKDYREVDVVDKVAVVFGAEENGISEYALKCTDHLIKIPMYGFTESFNISVSAAIVLEHYNAQIRARNEWPLTEQEKFELKFEWIQKSVPNVNSHIRRFEQITGLKKLL